MAHIEIYLNATANPLSPEKCDGCEKEFERGERMAGAVYESGESMGWFCDECIIDWKEKGVKSRIFDQSQEKDNGSGVPIHLLLGQYIRKKKAQRPSM